MTKSIKTLVAVSAALGFVLSGLSTASADVRSPGGTTGGGGSKVGKACKITSGPNAGKTGTYTQSDWGVLWCEGSFGGSNCKVVGCKDASSANLPGRWSAVRPVQTFPGSVSNLPAQTNPAAPKPNYIYKVQPTYQFNGANSKR